MMNVVLALHLMVAVALVGLVLMQRSEGGALGMGGGGGGLMSGRGAANALARGTSILGAVFFFTSITLTILAGGARTPASVVDAPASSPFAPITNFISGLTNPAPKPAVSVTPAPIVPLSPAPAPATPTGEVAPAPDGAVQRAAPLEGVTTIVPAAPAAALRPAAPVATAPRPQPAPSAIPRPAPLVRATPSVQVPAPAALTSVKPAESSEPLTPADRPRGRAGPDE